MNTKSTSRLELKTKHEIFKVGNNLITYHFRGYQKPIDQQWCVPLNFSEIEKLLKKDQVWIKSDLNKPQSEPGKIYGYTLVEVLDIMVISKEAVVKFTDGENICRVRISDSDKESVFHKITNEIRVYDLTKNQFYARNV